MSDHLEHQLVNELRAVIQPLNEKYKDFFHLVVITLCDMKDKSCSACTDSLTGQKCMRCIITFEEFPGKQSDKED
jgi:hypothetical protein